MKQTQYLALVALKKEFQERAKEIDSKNKVFASISVYDIDINAEVWQHQKTEVNLTEVNLTEGGKKNYLSNDISSEFTLFSKEF
jgi:hypothetical protein